ncbi:MAG: 1-deoxy-D-xylulose-5-phosphate reductoisomerase [Spirochaetes bacterium]|nr:1-deoxy-D-xylulose-5-phosphate reductoisomerase [Spirochaetota bacterium]
MKKRVAVLGATGSIGKSAIDILSKDRDSFDVVLLTAHRDFAALERLSALWPSALCLLAGGEGGRERLLAAILQAGADITINGIAGAAGLEPSLAAMQGGGSLALANKETIVMAAPLVFKLAAEKNAAVIPVDSEHSAVFNILKAHGRENVAGIILTASGGPFRRATLEEMERASPHDALAHPTWNMGAKISIDSATMANKGLELIEAAYFFNLPQEKIEVTVHRQSIVHSMVRFVNGAIYAQLSKPDMRHPIHDALYWPSTVSSGLEPLSFDNLTLEFEKPDLQKFPMLSLARNATGEGGLYPCAYNAANEVAVEAFLAERIGFLDIPRIVAAVLEKDWKCAPCDLPTVLAADKAARRAALTAGRL